MALIHNTAIRALNSSYNHAITVSPHVNSKRVADFLVFNKAIYTFLSQHHAVEEDYLFPAIEQHISRPGAMDANFFGHDAFMEAFQAWGAYINDPATLDNYSGTDMRNLISAFAPSLIQHLHDEIPTISALAAEPRCDSAVLLKIWQKAQEISTQDSNVHIEGPWIMGCQDRFFEIDGIAELGGWPPVPAPMRFVAKKWFSRRHKGAWEFCPSDFEGRRRILQF